MRQVTMVFFIVVCVLGLGAQDRPSAPMGPDEIIQKNIRAAGGAEKIGPIKNLTLDIPSRQFPQIFARYFVSATGELKVVDHMGEVATRIVTAKNGEFKVNSYQPSGRELKPLERARLTCLAKLYGGAFSLWRFRDDLTFKGKKKYGPKNYFCFETRLEDHDVAFFLDGETFLLKRLVFKGKGEEEGRYESAYDFGDAEDVDGFKIPATWFRTFVGAGPGGSGRGKITNFKTGPDFKSGFFDDREIDLGFVSLKEGTLQGSTLLSVASPRGYYLHFINWTDDTLAKLALKSKDKIKIVAGGAEYEGVYAASGSEIAPEMQTEQMVVLLRQPDDFPLIVFFGDKYKAVHENFKKLQKISVTKLVD